MQMIAMVDLRPTIVPIVLTILLKIRNTKVISELDSNVAAYFDRNENDNDYYTQAGASFDRVMTDQERENTNNNIIGAKSGISEHKRDEIINRQLCHWFRTST